MLVHDSMKDDDSCASNEPCRKAPRWEVETPPLPNDPAATAVPCPWCAGGYLRLPSPKEDDGRHYAGNCNAAVCSSCDVSDTHAQAFAETSVLWSGIRLEDVHASIMASLATHAGGNCAAGPFTLREWWRGEPPCRVVRRAIGGLAAEPGAVRFYFVHCSRCGEEIFVA